MLEQLSQIYKYFKVIGFFLAIRTIIKLFMHKNKEYMIAFANYKVLHNKAYSGANGNKLSML